MDGLSTIARLSSSERSSTFALERFLVYSSKFTLRSSKILASLARHEDTKLWYRSLSASQQAHQTWTMSYASCTSKRATDAIYQVDRDVNREISETTTVITGQRTSAVQAHLTSLRFVQSAFLIVWTINLASVLKQICTQISERYRST